MCVVKEKDVQMMPLYLTYGSEVRFLLLSGWLYTTRIHLRWLCEDEVYSQQHRIWNHTKATMPHFGSSSKSKYFM